MKKLNYRDFNKECGRNIFLARTQHRYSREYLARMAGISSKFLYEIEMGRKGCSSYVICRLADALGVSVNHLLDSMPEDGDAIEDLCSRFQGTQKEFLFLIIRLMYEMIYAY